MDAEFPPHPSFHLTQTHFGLSRDLFLLEFPYFILCIRLTDNWSLPTDHCP
jgi:hypothetical protein